MNAEVLSMIQAGRPVLQFCERFDDTSPNWNFSSHSHPYLELMYFTEGQSDLEISGQQMSAALYDAVVYPAHWTHQEAAAAKQRREIICLWIDLPELELPEPIHLHDQDGSLGRLFHSLHQEAKRSQPEPLILEYEIKLLLIMLLRGQNETQGKSTLSRAIQYVHTHYTQPITLDQLAELEHISQSYLCRLFKRQTGCSVISYIHKLRVETAKRLLIGTQDNIDEIASQVGFDSSKYFFRVFRALTGETPSAFRRRYQKQAPIKS